MKDMDIKELVKQAQQGSEQAFAGIYDEFADRIFKFIRLKVGHQQHAEDILQETFVKAWKGLSGLKLEELNFSAWLYRVASNAVNDYFRKMYSRPESLELDENTDIPDNSYLPERLDRQQELGELKRCLQTLPVNYRQVLELRFIQDFSVDETASILRKSNLATRLTQYRALKKLKEIILEENTYEYKKI